MDEGDRRRRDGHDGPTSAYDRTVDRFVTGLVPAARVWPLGRRVAIWAAGAAALVVISTIVTPRSDLAAYLARPMARLELGLLAAILVACGALTLRGAIPGSEPTPRVWVLAGLGVVLVAALALLGPVDDMLSLEHFIARGAPCARMTLGLAGLAALASLIMVGRAFPIAPAVTGAIAGIAGAVTAVLAMRLHCPLDETSHQLAFHASALLPVVPISALLGWGWQRLKTEP